MICSFTRRFLWLWIAMDNCAAYFRPRAKESIRNRFRQKSWRASANWNAKNELFRSTGSQCNSEWAERDFTRLRLLFHPAKESARSHEVHDLGVCDLDAVSDL